MEDIFWIEDEETMAALVDPMRIEIVEVLQTPHTVKEMAEVLGVPRTRLYHHVGLLEDRGIVTVVDTRRSGAKEERVFQAAARLFQPSPRFLESTDPRTQVTAVLDSLFAVTRADALASVDRSAESGRREFSRRVFFLTRTEAAELGERLDRILADYEGRSPSDGDPYSLLLVFHPSSRKMT